MKYKTVCSFFATAKVVGGEVEASDWNKTLNGYSEQGWKVREAGAVTDGPRLVFWALLARPGKTDRAGD